ncbi:MAG: hypothetical protein AB2L09_12785 [Coriobacteriia bacterium]
MLLWRPVGMRELELSYASGMKTFPPRLPHQPFFYPVLNQEYATRIARDWNTKEAPFAGYVTCFEVDDDYARQFEPHVVGGQQYVELWVPAAQLDEFNLAIRGSVGVIAAYFGEGFTGYVPDRFGLAGRDAVAQFGSLAQMADCSPMDFHLELQANELAVYLNFPFWIAAAPERLGVTPQVRDKVLERVRLEWSMVARRVELIERAQCMSWPARRPDASAL